MSSKSFLCNKGPEDMRRMNDAVFDILMRRLEEGTATAAEIDKALKFLKDNGFYTMTLQPRTGSLVEDIPTTWDDEEAAGIPGPCNH